jgi:hypothetical protein
MIQLPTGCRVAYEIRFMVNELTNDMGEWFNLIGGSATKVQWWDYRGREQFTNQVQYGKAKPSHRMQNSTGLTLIRFDGADASVASMFLIKFMDQIQTHNLREAEHYVY